MTKISEYLTAWGIPNETNIGGHGVVGIIEGKAPAGDSRKYEAVGIRADIDALPIQEEVKLSNLVTGILRRGSRSKNSLIDHCRNMEEIEAAEFIWNHPFKLEYIERQELGAVKDLTDPAQAANVEAKRKRGVTEYVTYTFNDGRKDWTIKLENIRGTNEQFYAIVKRQDS